MVAVTPYFDLHSEDILSAHISALQHNINKLETVLDLITVAKVDQPMNVVADQLDPSDQYKIYEGVDRNWLTSPAPVIKRNGSVVQSSDYTVKAAQGAVIFNVKQLPTDVVTADYTMITGDSNLLNTLSNSVTANTDSLSKIYKNIQVPYLIPKQAWILPNLKDMGSFSNLNPIAATGVSQASNTIDAFPFYVYEPMTLDQIKLTLSPGTVAANMIVGIYSNKDDLPDQLLGSTALFAVSAGDGTNKATYTQSLTADLSIVTPGLYWIARYQSAGIQMEGYSIQSPSLFMEIVDPDNSALINGSYSTIRSSGVRASNLGSQTSLPSIFPALTTDTTIVGCQYLKRASIGTVSIHRKL